MSNPYRNPGHPDPDSDHNGKVRMDWRFAHYLSLIIGTYHLIASGLLALGGRRDNALLYLGFAVGMFITSVATRLLWKRNRI